MSWWPSSWLPSIPSIDLSLPSSIQKRFLSFTLRQTLGHLLKPGQLDIQQVDSQIGSGYVQIRDVELDNEAINALLAGLPLELHDGSVGKVTARIPLPNPLTSTVGLSLESLHLTFNVSPTVAKTPQASNLAESMVSVAETFVHDELNELDEASLRQSFHSELASSMQSMDYVPGGLDPFVTDREGGSHDSDPPGVSIFATLVERLLARFEFDATDVKITLVHAGHSSFTFAVPSIRYRTELKNGDQPATSTTPVQGVTRTVQISGVNVTTRCLRPPSPQPLTSPAMSISQQQSSATITPSASPPHSPSFSDTSELDEETELMMSQSIVGLPQRPISPSSSVASSMYESAISNAPLASTVLDVSSHVAPGTPTPAPDDRPPTPKLSPPLPAQSDNAVPSLKLVTMEIEDETILSFGTEPIMLRLIAPPPTGSLTGSAQPSSSNVSSEGSHGEKKKVSQNCQPLKVELTVGVLAVAVRSRHIRSLLDIVNLWTSHSPNFVPAKGSTTPVEQQAASSIFDNLHASLRIRGIVTLLLPASGAASQESALSEFYKRPLVPPPLPHGFLRLHLETMSASLSTTPVFAPSSRTPVTVIGTTSACNFDISEITAFAFLYNPSIQTTHASPLLITDHNLAFQYPPTHLHPDLRQPHAQHVLPTFEITDWTDMSRDTNTAKLSTWRTKPLQGLSSTPGTPVSKPRDVGSSPVARSPVSLGYGRSSPSVKSAITTSPSHTPALHVEFTITSVTHSRSRAKGKTPESGIDVDIHLAPLHVFCDTSLLLNRSNPGEMGEALLFLEEITSSSSLHKDPGLTTEYAEGSEDEMEDEDEVDTPPATPHAQNGVHITRQKERERERERQRLERLVLEDLDLELDYRQTAPQKGRQTVSRVESWRKKQTRKKTKPQSTVSLKLPVLRIEVRNPPPNGLGPRSGAIVIDIHDIHIVPGSQHKSDKTGGLRFAEPEEVFSPEATVASHDMDTILSASWQRLTFAYSFVADKKAQMILSLGPLPVDGSPENVAQGISMESPPARGQTALQARPQVAISKSSPSASALETTAVSVDIPSVHVHIGKEELDGLQLWADDLSQVIERAFNPAAREPRSDSESQTDPSLIGSRFFNKARRSQGSGNASMASTVSASRSNSKNETVVKVAVSEVAITLALPREVEIRPFNIVASDVDLLMELKPEGKDETVVTLGVMDLSIRETSKDGTLQIFLNLTTPRNMMSNSAQPLLKLRFTSLVVSDSTAKETRIKVTISGITYTIYPDLAWLFDIIQFVKAPPGVFESVVPSERTRISLKVIDSSVRALCPTYPGAAVLHLGEVDFSTVMVGNIPETSFHLLLQAVSLFLVDDVDTTEEPSVGFSQVAAMSRVSRAGGGLWKLLGHALIAELLGVDLTFFKRDDVIPADVKVNLNRGELRLHLCADTGTALGAFISDFSSSFSSPAASPVPGQSNKGSAVEIAHREPYKRDLTASLDEQAFRRTIPQVGAAPDLISDDLPSNMEYLDDSFSASAGLRELEDEDLDDFNEDERMPVNDKDQTGLVSVYGGETVRLLDGQNLNIVENYFETLPPDAADESAQYGETTLKVRVQEFAATVFLYDGYDWARTRRIIEEEAKEMRRRLAKIRQLVASGQTPDPTVEETNTLLFNSVYIGLEHNIDELEPGALIAAIDEELNEDLETASQSSWQTLQHQTVSPVSPTTKAKRLKKNLGRSKGPSIEFRLQGVCAEVDNYRSHESLASRTLVTVTDVEILDHIKSSTWSKFLTSLRTDSRGNIRETGSNMVRVELRKVYPVPGNPAQEARLRAKILPLRLHVDQDALDFMKKFFSFKDPDAVPSVPSDPADEIYFQQAEVFPVDLKLDYKPRRVDYRALRDGKTIELMNFFHFDGAEMTLRHITLTGITGWAKVGDLLNDLWTPDVKATQLVDVISGVAPIRSVVNVGSGVADLVLLPIAQYKKDGRVVRGLQKGTTAFVKSTATEAIKLGARLATGTQVILEQAENVIGGQFTDPVTTEALQMPSGMPGTDERFGDDMDADDLISRYADQPVNVKEGVQSAYRSMKRNLHSAAQTILAVPMEVYERSGNEGAVRAVVRAVPIAVLRPMIGASEAVSKTLLGLHNTLDPNVRAENELKYKQR